MCDWKRQSVLGKAIALVMGANNLKQCCASTTMGAQYQAEEVPETPKLQLRVPRCPHYHPLCQRTRARHHPRRHWLHRQWTPVQPPTKHHEDEKQVGGGREKSIRGGGTSALLPERKSP